MMDHSPEVIDALFRVAVQALDDGNAAALEHHLSAHPYLVSERLEYPGEWLRTQVGGALDGFFKSPYLLWFVAEDPVRNGTLPASIATLARILVQSAQRQKVPSLQQQLDQAVRLVAWSWIARQCGVQIALLDVLLDAGASPLGGANNALVNSNVSAAEHLVRRGDALTLGSALCLGRWDEMPRLFRGANDAEKRFAVVLAALNGQSEGLRRILELGVDVNAPSEELYSHGTPLHHAVCSGSPDAVRVLVEGGGDLRRLDTHFGATPLGWALHYLGEAEAGSARAERYVAIAEYLKEREAEA
jgi:hypothetical protein